MAYTKKPKAPPTFDAGAFTNSLLAGKPITDAQKAGFVNWKQWVESSSEFAGADDGGLRAVLKADAYGVDELKTDHDTLVQRVNNQDSRLDALEAAPISRPFP